MKWSLSEARMYKRCPRQWYFKAVVASPVAKDPYRRKVYLLGKLQSVQAWRGHIVDHVISTLVVEAVRKRQRITLEQARRRAHELFRSQLRFAKANSVPPLSASPSSPDFVILHPLYYGGELASADIAAALSDIDRALANLYSMDEVKQAMKAATVLIAQRSLVFQHSGASIRAVPDLIAFYEDRAPVLFDWKVHTFGIHEAWLQLGIYALALTKCSPHKDFPPGVSTIAVSEIELLEVQLLTKSCRRSRLGEDEIERVEAYIADSVMEIETAVGGRSHEELLPDDFGVTTYPNTCRSCAFQEPCWSGDERH